LLWGVLVETEAYSQEEPACHGYRRRTPSNETLLGEPGRFYVYVSYRIQLTAEEQKKLEQVLKRLKQPVVQSYFLSFLIVNQDSIVASSGSSLIAQYNNTEGAN